MNEQYQKVPVEDFPWPCDRRDAHHAHEGYLNDHHQYAGEGKRCKTCRRAPSHQVHQVLSCPGVQAHPATMAGTTYRLAD